MKWLLVALLIYSSLVFASELEGQWETSRFVCRLSNESVKEINDVKDNRYPNVLMFGSHQDNQFFKLIANHGECNSFATGTYLINETSLILNIEKSKSRSDGQLWHLFLGGFPCALATKLSKFEAGRVIVYENFFLRSDSLYLGLDDSASQQCPDGTIFQQFVRKKTNILDTRYSVNFLGE